MTTIRTYKTKRFTVTLKLQDLEESSFWLRELYAPSDVHIAGQTIQVPAHLQERHCPKYYIGQTTPAELAKDYAKQGRKNPSKEAYESLQKELGWYITAGMFCFVCTVEKNGFQLAETYGTSFDYSYEYSDQSLEDYVVTQGYIKDYARELVKEAIEEARDTLELLAA